MGAFAKGVAKLEAKGESAKEAKAVMAIAGRKRYGVKGMAAKAAAGRHAAAAQRAMRKGA